MSRAASAHSPAQSSVRSAARTDGGPGTDPSPWRTSLAAYVETTKPGITKLVTITSMVGLGMALAQRWTVGDRLWNGWDLAVIVIGSILGTALSASGANALNQWAERERDGLMPRTAKRPLPAGTLQPSRVFAFAAALVVVGLAVLWLTSGLAAMCVSAACVGVYLFLYTPLKTQTWTATLIGAIPGALPPLIGWCAGYRELGFEAAVAPGGVALFVLMFVWQLPHFLAIAWMYREDYARGGHAVLPVVDQSGVKTSVVIAVFTVLLIPATVSPVVTMPRVLGPLSLFTAAVSGLVFAGLVARLLKTRRREHARAVFFASIIHLPLLLVVMVLDAFVRTLL
ncbi:MAG: heme o synthase [Phycisphaerales bacterium JB041]